MKKSWDNARLADQNAKLRNALVGCERAGELLACAGHKEKRLRRSWILCLMRLTDPVVIQKQSKLGGFTYPDITKKIPPVLSLHQLDNKHCWIERPIYAVQTVEPVDQTAPPIHPDSRAAINTAPGRILPTNRSRPA